MNIEIIQELTYQHFEEMEALELQFYGPEFITPPQETWSWYQRYPLCTIAAGMGGRIVGFVNLFPVQPRVYELLAAGRFNDHFMELADVADVSAPPLHMFLSCIVVAEEARPHGVTRRLLQAAVQAYSGYQCKRVVTDNVTPAGTRFSERYGFTRRCRSDHGSWVYEQDWDSFAARVNGGKGSAI